MQKAVESLSGLSICVHKLIPNLYQGYSWKPENSLNNQQHKEGVGVFLAELFNYSIVLQSGPLGQVKRDGLWGLVGYCKAGQRWEDPGRFKRVRVWLRSTWQKNQEVSGSQEPFGSMGLAGGVWQQVSALRKVQAAWHLRHLSLSFLECAMIFPQLSPMQELTWAPLTRRTHKVCPSKQ